MHLIVSVPEIIYLFSLLLVVFIFILLISLLRQLDFFKLLSQIQVKYKFLKEAKNE